MTDNNELAIHEISQEAKIFHIPNYQRGYRWTEDEVQALLDDLHTVCSVADNVYCLQPLVLEKRKDGRTFVVDGQQRLTTLAIILRILGVRPGWDIEYTAEGNRKLSDLLAKPGSSINDYFRNGAREAVEGWLKEAPERCDDLKQLLKGSLKGKRVVFLRHEIASGEDGHDVFQRLNAGKTPLTSSELIRALFMEAGNGLTDGEKADIAKEWDLIESAMTDTQFWAIWNNRDFRDVSTRMDFLFSIVMNVKSKDTRHDPLLVYSRFEKLVLNGNRMSDELRKRWEDVLRCWWWMQSCYGDAEAAHLLGWLALFTDPETRVMFRVQWNGDAKCRMKSFKALLRKHVAESIGDVDFDSLRYDHSDLLTLRKVFVLLNMLEAERRGIRFRFDLYQNDSWDVEHIASQTDNPLDKREEREDWLRLAEAEMSEAEKKTLAQYGTFEEKWQAVWMMFERRGDAVSDKDAIGNLVLLDSTTNRSYKNAIFPAKRRWILLELPNEVRKEEKYVLPATEAAFAKSYSPAAAQMRYWSKEDADAYRKGMKEMFKGFIKTVDGGVR